MLTPDDFIEPVVVMSATPHTATPFSRYADLITERDNRYAFQARGPAAHASLNQVASGSFAGALSAAFSSVAFGYSLIIPDFMPDIGLSPSEKYAGLAYSLGCAAGGLVCSGVARVYTDFFAPRERPDIGAAAPADLKRMRAKMASFRSARDIDVTDADIVNAPSTPPRAMLNTPVNAACVP